MGLDEDTLSAIEARSKKSRASMKTTWLYNDIATMKEFKMTPIEWASLSRTRKKILNYFRIMENHFTMTHHEEIKEEIKQKQEQAKRDARVKAKMPGLRR